MTTLFLIHATQDAACAAQLRQDLGARGYPLWLATPDGYGDAWETGLGNSRTVVVVWSTAAAQDALVAQQIERSTWLYKPLVVVAVDGTPLPASLARVPVVQSAQACADAAVQLLAYLPPGGDSSLLRELLAQQPTGAPAAIPQPAAHPVEEGPLFGVPCSQGHITYFDKRVVCRHDGTVLRSMVTRKGKQLDTLRLPCGTPGCDEWVVADVDCEGYR